MHFAIYFDNREHSRLSLKELGLEESGPDRREGLLSWGINYGDLGVGELLTFSRLLGKRLIAPLPKERCGIWPFDNNAEFPVQFIVDVDEAGTPRFDSAVGYGGNTEHLTPVWFQKAVLDRYYALPGKYAVEDGYLRCGSLWGMVLDNHHQGYVVAWLGDLNRDLPHQEQLHWRGHNVPRCGPVSKVFLGRQLECRPLDSDQPEHLFQMRYDELAVVCQKKLGWQVILPLGAQDHHYKSGIRIPSTDEQKDFDDLVLGLSKTLIDSLNEDKLAELIPNDVRKALRGSIAKLEAAFAANGIEGYAEHIQFMRNLQNLRSTGTAHRKGSNYVEVAAKFAVLSQSLRNVFRGILDKCIRLLEYLIQVVQEGKLVGSKSIPP